MGIAYSNSRIVYTALRCDTSANLRSDIDAALSAAGVTTKTPVTNGYKYTLVSPQSLKCKLLVQDTGETKDGHHVVNLQFLSLDESLAGFEHHLLYGAAAYSAIGYEMQAGVCQFFIALKGVADFTDLGGFAFSRNYSVAGGIPYVAAQVAGTECAAAGGTSSAVTQIFWSCGMEADNEDFRNGRRPDQCYSYCLNGAVFVQPAGPAHPDNAYTGGLKLYPLTPTMNIDNSFGQWARVVKYKTLDPLYYDAFVGWSFAIQGQLWDAVMASRDETLDSTITSTQTDASGNTIKATWLAWNHFVHSLGGIDYGDGGTFWSTLYLLIGKPLTTGKLNIAY